MGPRRQASHPGCTSLTRKGCLASPLLVRSPDAGLRFNKLIKQFSLQNLYSHIHAIESLCPKLWVFIWEVHLGPPQDWDRYVACTGPIQHPHDGPGKWNVFAPSPADSCSFSCQRFPIWSLSRVTSQKSFHTSKKKHILRVRNALCPIVPRVRGIVSMARVKSDV